MIMNNSTNIIYVNGTASSPVPTANVGLAVGLTLFFLLLIIAAMIVYKYQNRIRSTFKFGQRGSQEKEDPMESPEPEAHQYTSMRREPPTGGQTPIYENLTRNVGHSQPAASQSRLPGEPEEDLYLQCDTQDDAIYSNDPAFQSVPSEEDVYVVPDAE